MRDPVMVMDNVEAMRILTDVGLMGKMQPLDGFNSTHVYFNYQDYRCIGMYHRGHKEDKDNGFMVVMLPNEMMSEQEARALMMDMVNKPGTGRIEYAHIETNPNLQ